MPHASRLHALAAVAFESGDEELKEQLQRALGASRGELRQIYAAGESLTEAIRQGNHAAVAAAPATSTLTPLEVEEQVYHLL